jgi:hypothetical protein
LISALLPAIQAHPEQCGRDLLLSLRKGSRLLRSESESPNDSLTSRLREPYG